MVEELSAADRSLLALLGLAGAVLVVSDAITTMKEIRRIVQFLALLLGLAALLAVSQYVLGYDPLAGVSFPGLDIVVDYETDSRAGLTRANGTAVHPIEYGAVIVMGLPLLIHAAAFARRFRILAWGAVLVALLSIVMALSKSSILGFLVVFLVMVPTWPRVWRWVSIAVLALGAIGARAIFPGLLGTLIASFTFISVDPSTQGRTQDYEAVVKFFAERPLFGLGEGTFLPQLYRILDNQYLLTLVVQGLVGLTALLFSFLAAIWLAARTRRLSADKEVRHLAQALLASTCAAMLMWTLFDAYSFPQAFTELLIVFGLIAALSRVSADEANRSPGPSAPRSRRQALISMGVAAVIVGGATFAWYGQVQYVATATTLIRPSDAQFGVFTADDGGPAASLLADYLGSRAGQRDVRNRGGTAACTTAQGDGSLVPLTEYRGVGSVFRVQAIADSPEAARATLDACLASAAEELRRAQANVDSPEPFLARMEVVAISGPQERQGSRVRTAAAVILAWAATSGFIYAATASIRTAVLRRRMNRGAPAPDDPAPVEEAAT